MYRQYENPYELEDELKMEKERINQPGYEPDDLDYERIADLEDGVNFAWQDDEYDQEEWF